MARFFIIVGAVFLALGLLWPFLSKIGFGRLPGDINITGERYSIHFPLMSALIASLIISMILNLFGR